MAATTSSAPANNASTLPSLRLRTQPSRRRAPEHDRQLRRRRDRFEFAAILDPGEEQRIDAGSFIGLRPRDRVVETGDRDRTGAPDDDQRGIAAPVERSLHLANAFVERNKLRLRLPERLWQQRVLDRQTPGTGS